jgi:uracil-DNA glycosylase family protein
MTTPAGAAPYVPADADLGQLRSAAQQCRGCELYRDATQAVIGDGPEDAALMLIGEQPGDMEDTMGEPFVGPAGKLLDKALAAAGIEPGSVFKTNAVKHFRFSGTKNKRRIHESPSRVHIAASEPWLVAELSLVQPQGVVLLGAVAGKAVFGSGFRVTESRGKLLDWPPGALATEEDPPAWALATTHPSAVLRSRDREEMLVSLVADLTVAAKALR